MKVYTGAGKDVVIKPPYVKNQELGGGDTPYIMPRQTGAGATRATQQIKGSLSVVDDQGIVRVVVGYEKGGF